MPAPVYCSVHMRVSVPMRVCVPMRVHVSVSMFMSLSVPVAVFVSVCHDNFVFRACVRVPSHLSRVTCTAAR